MTCTFSPPQVEVTHVLTVSMFLYCARVVNISIHSTWPFSYRKQEYIKLEKVNKITYH